MDGLVIIILGVDGLLLRLEGGGLVAAEHADKRCRIWPSDWEGFLEVLDVEAVLVIEKPILNLFSLHPAVSLAVTSHYSPHRALQLLCGLIYPEEFNANGFAIGEELLPQQQHLHLLVYLGQVVYQDVL